MAKGGSGNPFLDPQDASPLPPCEGWDPPSEDHQQCLVLVNRDAAGEDLVGQDNPVGGGAGILGHEALAEKDLESPHTIQRAPGLGVAAGGYESPAEVSGGCESPTGVSGGYESPAGVSGSPAVARGPPTPGDAPVLVFTAASTPEPVIDAAGARRAR